MKKIAFFLFIAAFLSGCGTTHLALKKDAASEIETIDHIVLVPQNNIDIDVTPSDGGAGGLIGVLIAAGIDAARRSSAKEEASPLVEELKGFDFRNVMLEALNSEIKEKNLVQYKINSTLETIDTETNNKITFDKSIASAVMFNSVNYKIMSGNLVITSKVMMYPKTNSLLKYRAEPNKSDVLDDGNVIYKGFFTFKKEGIDKDNIKDSLIEGAKNLSYQMLRHLGHSEKSSNLALNN